MKPPTSPGASEFSVASKPLLDNDRVVVWDYPGTATPTRHAHVRDTVVVWTDGGQGRAIFLPAGTTHAWSGLSYQENESSGQARYLYAISIVVVFLCLAALYESWLVPLAVLPKPTATP